MSMSRSNINHSKIPFAKLSFSRYLSYPVSSYFLEWWRNIYESISITSEPQPLTPESI